MTRKEEQQIKTARCILTKADKYFLVVHQSRMFSGRTSWGLPGGRVEQGETCGEALIRELNEELYICINHFLNVGDYKYKGHTHRIFAAECNEKIVKFDRNEIKKIGWHSAEQVKTYEQQGLLHTGFEWQAIPSYILFHKNN